MMGDAGSGPGRGQEARATQWGTHPLASPPSPHPNTLGSPVPWLWELPWGEPHTGVKSVYLSTSCNRPSGPSVASVKPACVPCLGGSLKVQASGFLPDTDLHTSEQEACPGTHS